MEELVSIIIPTYNRGHLIKRSIDSVLSQTYSNVEIIIVDDCSTDATEVLITKAYRNENRVKYYRLEQNSGACYARNKGIELSKGLFIGFLDSDDEFLPDKIESQINLIKIKNVEFCVSDFVRKYEDGRQEIVHVSSNENESLYHRLLYSNFITTGTLLGYRYCFNEICFDRELPRFQDWDLVLRLSKKYTFGLLPKNTLIQYHQEQSITTSTGHEKTLKALMIIQSKHEDDYNKNVKAKTQMDWMIGIRSMYTDYKMYSKLWSGVTGDGLSIKRLLIFLMLQLGVRKIFTKYF